MAARKGGKTALVLASGGLTGVAYEVGALRALDHILTNRTVNDFDIYVGTSAGAVVAASLANGMPPIMLAGLLAGTVPGFRRLSRLALYRLNVGEAVQRMWGAPALVRDALGDFWRFRDRMPFMETLYALAPLLPSGIFSNEGIVDYVVETFATAGLSDDFGDLAKELHIIAADIETDERVDFSMSTTPNVPISRAVAASTSIPLVFRPVEIDGHHYVDGGIKGQAAVDIAIDRGARLIVIVNGLVPLDTVAIGAHASTDEARRSIFDLGLRAIGNQVLRGMLHDSLVNHVKSLRQEHPEVDFILIEPRPDDEKMFFHEVMSFSAQMIVLQHGYETVISGLYQNWPYISRVLPRHGIEITRKVVESKPLEVSVKEMEKQGNMIGRLFQTVLDRRTTAGQRAEVMSTVDTQPASARRARAGGSAARRPAAAKKAATRKSAAAGGATGAQAPRRGGFRPRIVGED
ncbi:MAG TPA: patatin-like phospholipase family protein [Candidatus Solibacter sp.]|jgi:NTE family protein|nr:patatin-like phospholipase family protein [Candidatus Solibacter sp.]